jgi:hypothetical protein
MSVSIQVCVRCRPFSVQDRLAVLMEQTSPTDGEITLLNTTYTTTRFGFTWAWWSAYGWERNCDERDSSEAERMKLVNQDNAYSMVGTVIKKDLMEGNAIVIFAYVRAMRDCSLTRTARKYRVPSPTDVISSPTVVPGVSLGCVSVRVLPIALAFAIQSRRRVTTES